MHARIAAPGAFALAIAAAALAPACGGDGARRLREHTYPPSFHYITRQEIRTTMGLLAVELTALDARLTGMTEPGPGDREEILAILTRMEALAGSLKRGMDSNHPQIDRDAPRLRDDIERALRGARLEPPNYYDAGVVSGSCAYCHGRPAGDPR